MTGDISRYIFVVEKCVQMYIQTVHNKVHMYLFLCSLIFDALEILTHL